jgi:hypothetical protein|tara:strand:+ start:472 stop:615 length:144 start_codon:yes stop_codon:yes gene_type:complete
MSKLNYINRPNEKSVATKIKEKIDPGQSRTQHGSKHTTKEVKDGLSS